MFNQGLTKTIVNVSLRFNQVLVLSNVTKVYPRFNQSLISQFLAKV
jgi:hypothetical protein